jgi:hypothetical protein
MTGEEAHTFVLEWDHELMENVAECGNNHIISFIIRDF